MADVCMVCLEEAADVQPPCGGSEVPMFHKGCLEQVERAQRLSCFRCPHCNVPVRREPDAITAALVCDICARVRDALVPWLQREGHWIMPELYVLVQANNFMLGELEEKLQAALQDEMMFLLCGSVSCDRDIGFRAYRQQESNGTETAVCIWRSACVGRYGSVLSDGFTLWAQRFRYSPRHRRTLVDT